MTVNRNAKQYEPVNVETSAVARDMALKGRIELLENAPPPHGPTHAIGGTDQIPIGVATTTEIGFMPTLNGNVNSFLAGDGTWQTPAGGGGGSQAETLAKISFGGF